MSVFIVQHHYSCNITKCYDKKIALKQLIHLNKWIHLWVKCWTWLCCLDWRTDCQAEGFQMKARHLSPWTAPALLVSDRKVQWWKLKIKKLTEIYFSFSRESFQHDKWFEKLKSWHRQCWIWILPDAMSHEGMKLSNNFALLHTKVFITSCFTLSKPEIMWTNFVRSSYSETNIKLLLSFCVGDYYQKKLLCATKM